MAATKVDLTKMKREVLLKKPDSQAVSATDGALVKFAGNDEKILIIVENSGTSAESVAVKAGNGIQGVSDLTLSASAGSVNFLVVESGKYKVMSGEGKGCVKITASANVKLSAVLLP